MVPAQLAVDGIDPNVLALVLQFAGASPVAVGLFFGLWVGGKAIAVVLRAVLEAKSDAAIRAVVGLTVAIRNATQGPAMTPPAERRPARSRRTGPNPVVPE